MLTWPVKDSMYMPSALHPTSLQARQCMPVFVLMLSSFDFTLHVQDVTCKLLPWILPGSKLIRLAVQVH